MTWGSPMDSELWRVGHRVPINVYEGDRPVCQCHNEVDAARIVEAVNERDVLVHPLVLAERQRREDVVAELRLQLASLERQMKPALDQRSR
jgi:hypothetical protein